MSVVPFPRPPADPPQLAARAMRDCNDLGNAERLALMAAPERADGTREPLLLWVDDGQGGRWAAFDGQRWSMRDGEATARRMAQAVAKGMRDEALALAQCSGDALAEAMWPGATDDHRNKRVAELWAWAQKSGDAARTAAMLKQAQVDPLLAAHIDDFDRDPLAWHCLNGTVRFVQHEGKWTHRFEPGHRPADRFMVMANAVYDCGAACDEWEKRLKLIQPDAEQRGILRTLYGSTMTGLISDQSFYVHQGKGGDGKSVTHWVLGEIHGGQNQGGYFRTASPLTFLEGPTQAGSAHQSDIIRLKGDVRMVVCDEPKRGAVWDGQRIKQITGSTLTARAPHAREEESFVVRWKLFVECNALPRAPSDDDGFRRRFKLFTWLVQFHKTAGLSAEPEHVVKARLIGEKSGIVNWMIGGALEFLNSGMRVPVPAAMAEALGNYWEASSPLGEWMETWCDTSDKSAKEPATPLYQHFKNWCEAQGIEKPMQQTGFGRALSERHIMSRPGAKGVKMRHGVRLRSDAEVEAMQAVLAAANGAVVDAVPPVADAARGTSEGGDYDGWDGL